MEHSMNNFSATISSSHTTALTRNQDGTCTFETVIPPFKDEEVPVTLLVKAWGKLAERVAAEFPLQRDVEIRGQIHLPKGGPIELHLSAFNAFPMGTISLVGRAGADPEVKFFDSGSLVAKLRLAVNRRSRDDEPDWFNLEIWGKQAQVAADYVRKGSLLGITGSLAMESWADKATGEVRSKPVVKVDRLDLIGSRRDSETHGTHGTETSKPAASASWTPPSAGGWAPPSGGAL
jgi:single-strand DNA-binding protein